MNKLINETSPYLLQHAHNPVNWYPWGDEALQLAKQQDKPILVSIGYSACHWCHVMERESFEDESTASVMNTCFINIKIDREERPDLDHIYMDALQNMTGGGGWPLNVFLTPEGKPFYGGTYYPPRRAHNRPSWKEVLLAVHDGYQNKKTDVFAQAENLTKQLANANNFGIAKTAEGDYGSIFNQENLATIAANILQQADAEWGGFGRAPKFPQTFSVQFLLRHYHYTKHQPSLQQALLSINKMMQGGIYDHIGGGFARYSTDTEWLAPHFEKMLYDNALLINIISEAYQLTGEARYAEVIEDTIAFLEREMLSPEGGFYSALDADSEGEEGRFYVWAKHEVADVLGPDADLFCKVYNVTDDGNWEHNNIIWLKRPMEELLLEAGVNPKQGAAILKSCRVKLLNERTKRVRPGLDDKILVGWNALMITACCKAASATGNQRFGKLAQNCMLFLEATCGAGTWQHTYKNGVAKYPAFLDDCAYLIQAYINLQEITGNSTWLYKAKALTEQVVRDFTDDEQQLFYYTPAGQENLIVRKKEVYDGATPSGNAVMAQNLHYLSVIFNNNHWLARAQAMVASLAKATIKYPVSFGCWASVLQNIAIGTNEIAIIGGIAHTVLQELNRLYVPNKAVQASVEPGSDFPLLAGKTAAGDDTLIYLCKNYACLKPVTTVQQLVNLF